MIIVLDFRCKILDTIPVRDGESIYFCEAKQVLFHNVSTFFRIRCAARTLCNLCVQKITQKINSKKSDAESKV